MDVWVNLCNGARRWSFNKPVFPGNTIKFDLTEGTSLIRKLAKKMIATGGVIILFPNLGGGEFMYKSLIDAHCAKYGVPKPPSVPIPDFFTPSEKRKMYTADKEQRPPPAVVRAERVTRSLTSSGRRIWRYLRGRSISG